MASITPNNVRLYILDYPGANDLLGEHQFTAEQIERAIDFVIANFNESPPLITGYTKVDFPFRELLLTGVVAHLYRGLAFHEERNRLPVSTGGVSVDDSARASSYTQLASNLKAEYEEQKLNIRISLNMSRGWGGVGSDYF